MWYRVEDVMSLMADDQQTALVQGNKNMWLRAFHHEHLLGWMPNIIVMHTVTG